MAAFREGTGIRKRGLRLEIEPKPISTWGITLASRLPKKEWDDIRTKCYRMADYTCQVCEVNGGKLHCHECWSFDDRRNIQKLVDFKCLCELCHDVKHFGRSSQVYDKAYVKKLIKHWCKVNKKTEKDFQAYEYQIQLLNRKRADRFYVVKVGRKILV